MSQLANIPYEEIRLGQTATYSKTIGEREVTLFALVSGDINPLHLDADYAKTTPFGERIAGHAFGQAGNDPGPGCRVGDVPRLGLGFPAKRGGNLGRRMDLYGKIRLGIQ